jgi:hypothetical protein
VAAKKLKITKSCALLSTAKIIEKKQRVDLLLDPQCRKHNEQVKKNRVILLRHIDVVRYLNNQEFPFQGRDESSISFNKGDFVELLNVLNKHGPLLENHLNSTTLI